MHCSRCKQEHPDGTLFCPFTGKRIELEDICPGCGEPVDQGWLHCGNCGHRLDQVETDLHPPAAQGTGAPRAPTPTANLSNIKKASLKLSALIITAGTALLFLAAAVWWVLSNNQNPAEVEANATNPPTATNAIAYAPPTAPNLDTPSQSAGWKITVTNAHEETQLLGNDGVTYQPASDFTFLVVEAAFLNLDATQLVTVTDSEVTIIDSAGEIIYLAGARQSPLETYVMGYSTTTTAYGGNSLELTLAYTVHKSNIDRVFSLKYLDEPPVPFTLALFAQTPGMIAFDSDRDGNLEIYVMNADGSNQTNLSNNPADDMVPSWSGDGQKIAFVSARDGNDEIYVMDADGSNQTRLTQEQAIDTYPNWSADGRKIAFVSARDGNWEIYVMNADGSEQTRLTRNQSIEALPTWSADGQKIAFTSERDGNPELYVMNANGGDQTRLTMNQVEDAYPHWSADGQKIAFVSERDGNQEIYVMNVDGSGQTRLTYNEAGDSAPSWSADGQNIVFASNRDGTSKIYRMNADGSAQVRITDNQAGDSFPDWSHVPRDEIPAPSASFTTTPSTTSEASLTPSPGTVIVNAQLGIAFTVPNGIDLYSEDNPGTLGALLSQKEPYIKIKKPGNLVGFLASPFLFPLIKEARSVRLPGRGSPGSGRRKTGLQPSP